MIWAGLSNSWVFIIIAGIIALRLFAFFTLQKLLSITGMSFQNNKFLLHYSSRQQWFKLILFMAGCFSLGLSFLQPQWGKKQEKVDQKGRDLYVLLDVSRSMLAEDMNPSRLEFAKAKIRKLISQLGTDRVALVLFSSKPIIQCPLTQDMQALNLFLDQIDADTIGMGTTAIDSALKKVLEQCDRVKANKSSIVVLLTDGEDFSNDLAAVRKEARKKKLNIFALGLGSPHGAPIPNYKAGQKSGVIKDEKGEVVISKLNAPLLQNLVIQIGGIYINPTENDHDVTQVVHKVQQFEKRKFSNKKASALQEQYPWFIGFSLLCFLLELIL